MQEPIAWYHLGLCDYDQGLRSQERHWRARCDGGPNIGLVLEHPPTVTLGLRGNDQDLRVPRAMLAEQGIACIATDRGGQATYHGPGQLILYPIVDLRALGITVPCFVWSLEEAMIRVAAHFGVDATRDPRGRGVWTPSGKLGAVGIRVREHVTTHGLALNVDPNLDAFKLIVPCGMPDADVTSLARECGQSLTTDTVRPLLQSTFEATLATVVARDPSAEVHP